MYGISLFRGELVGFSVPDWMIDKMKAYIETARTHPDTSDEELLRMAEEYAEMEEGRRAKGRSCGGGGEEEQQQLCLDRFMAHSEEASGAVDQLLIDIKHEVDDDLQNLDPGFLQAGYQRLFSLPTAYFLVSCC
jgi:hypothetical protein